MTTSTRNLFPKGKRRGPSQETRLREAWIALREGRGSREDADLAFGDLAEFSGYYAVADPFNSASVGPATAEQLWYSEGRRSVFARICFLLDITDDELTALQRLAREEMGTSAEEGER